MNYEQFIEDQQEHWLNFSKQFYGADLSDPRVWLRQARAWKALVKHLIILCLKDRGTKMFATIPYNVAIAIELYLKGYLLASRAVDIKQVRQFGHDLKALRKKSFDVSKNKEFHNPMLVFHTDMLGSLLTDAGGVRYPRSTSTGISISDIEVLRLLDKLLSKQIRS